MASSLIAVGGATACGKTAVAIALARQLGGEVVSCDSMQVYRGMDIGTAKPTRAERAAVPHHLLDILEPGEEGSLADFAARAREAITDITRRGRLPILCGGTGLYLDHVLSGRELCGAGRDDAYRAELRALSSQDLYRILAKVDPETAEKVHPNNRARVVRALEIYHTTGQPKSVWDARSRATASPPRALRILLTCERMSLYARIDARVDAMFAAGLVEEVRSLLPRLTGTAAGAIGYKEVAAYLRGECSLDEAAARVKMATRNYASRQITWFRHDGGAWRPLPIDGKTKGQVAAQAYEMAREFLEHSREEE